MDLTFTLHTCAGRNTLFTCARRNTLHSLPMLECSTSCLPPHPHLCFWAGPCVLLKFQLLKQPPVDAASGACRLDQLFSCRLAN